MLIRLITEAEVADESNFRKELNQIFQNALTTSTNPPQHILHSFHAHTCNFNATPNLPPSACCAMLIEVQNWLGKRMCEFYDGTHLTLVTTLDANGHVIHNQRETFIKCMRWDLFPMVRLRVFRDISHNINIIIKEQDPLEPSVLRNCSVHHACRPDTAEYCSIVVTFSSANIANEFSNYYNGEKAIHIKGSPNNPSKSVDIYPKARLC